MVILAIAIHCTNGGCYSTVLSVLLSCSLVLLTCFMFVLVNEQNDDDDNDGDDDGGCGI